MAYLALETFLKEVLPYCPDLAEHVAVNAIRNSCMEFSRLTTIHRMDIAPIDGVATQSEYTIVVPVETQLATPIKIYYSGIELKPRSEELLVAQYKYQDWTTITGQPAFFTQLNPGTIKIVPYPSVNYTGAITGRISLMPTRAAMNVYDDLYNRYSEEIALGARSRLHYTPGQPYFDPNMAEQCKQKFMDAIGATKARANQGQTRSVSRVLYNKF